MAILLTTNWPNTVLCFQSTEEKIPTFPQIFSNILTNQISATTDRYIQWGSTIKMLAPSRHAFRKKKSELIYRTKNSFVWWIWTVFGKDISWPYDGCWLTGLRDQIQVLIIPVEWNCGLYFSSLSTHFYSLPSSSSIFTSFFHSSSAVKRSSRKVLAFIGILIRIWQEPVKREFPPHLPYFHTHHLR